MGYLLKPECSCGHSYKEIFMGGEMVNFETTCKVPFFCIKCKTIKIRNLFKKKQNSKNCEEENEKLGGLDDKTKFYELDRIIPKGILNNKFKCGKCRNDLKMYGEIVTFLSDEKLNLEEINNLYINSFEWSFSLEMTYYLPSQSNYCPKCKSNSLQFTSCGIWD